MISIYAHIYFMNKLEYRLDHEVDEGWHVNWEDGVCTYVNEYDMLIVERKVHRHPFGTEYAETIEE